MHLLRILLPLAAVVLALVVLMSSNKRQQTAASIPVMLPKGSPLLLGPLISVAIGYTATYVLYWGLWVLGATPSVLLFWLCAGTSGALGFLAFYNGFFESKKEVPIGWGGMPLILKGRPWFQFLLPEGIQFSLKYIFEVLPIDMRARPLKIKPPLPEDAEKFEFDEDASDSDDTMRIIALAKVIPPDVTTPAGKEHSDTVKNVQKVFEIPVIVKAVARVRTFNPFLRLDFDDPDQLLFAQMQERVREFVRGVKNDGKDAYDLPDLKEEMTESLLEQLDEAGRPMGTDFVRLFVTQILLPKDVSQEGVNLLRELIQRSGEKYQAETLAQTADILKKMFPTLDEKELKNMVLTAAHLATTTAYSFEGQGPIPIVPLGTPNQPSDGGHHG